MREKIEVMKGRDERRKREGGKEKEKTNWTVHNILGEKIQRSELG